MAINKVVYGNDVLIDLSSDTAEASDVAQGKTFHLKSGAQATGTALGGTSIYDGDDSTGDLYNELFLSDVASGVDNVKVAFDMDLLWTNPNPTSSFSPQTVSLDLTEYKMAYIIWRTSLDAITYHDTTSLIDGLLRESVNRNGETTSQFGLSWRTYTVSSQSVAFDEGHQQTAFSNQTGIENNRMIPYQIYGIR